MDDAFYLPVGGALAVDGAHDGPWDKRFQHGGPPAALLARAAV